MHIMMFGQGGVGKTTYMATMYDALYRSMLAGNEFGIRALDDSHHESLLELAGRIGRYGHYPLRTDLRECYEFQLFHNAQPVMPFTWTDIRGGALESRSDQSADLPGILEALSKADAILLFFDAKALADAHGRHSRQVGRLTSLLGSAIGDVKRLLPIALVLTQCDRITEDDQDKILAHLRELMLAIRASTTLHGALIDTACGIGTATNVDKPVQFVLQRGMLAHLRRLSDAIDSDIKEAQRYEDRGGFWDSLTSAFKGEMSYHDLAEYKRSKAREALQLHNSLVEPVNRLIPYLEQVITF